MNREIVSVKNKKEKLISKRDAMNMEIDKLQQQQDLLEGREIVVVCHKKNISLYDLIKKIEEEKEIKNEE